MELGGWGRSRTRRRSREVGGGACGGGRAEQPGRQGRGGSSGPGRGREENPSGRDWADWAWRWGSGVARAPETAEESWTATWELDLSCKARFLGARSQDRLGRYARKTLPFGSLSFFNCENEIPTS